LSPRAADPHDERLVDLASDLLATISHGYFTRLNPAWERLLGWTVEELCSRPCLSFVHPDDAERTIAIGGLPGSEVARFENRYRCKDGSWRSLSWTAYNEADTWYAVARDVSDREDLERLAQHDPLTGLPNRLLFGDRLKLALARLKRRDTLLALCFVDLDRLKLVNDGFGHDLGDRFLVAVAQRLHSSLREADTIARVGGDEFVRAGRGAR
jgi:diguanylate cyclase